MPSKHIYLPDELYFKLKNSDENISELITRLLYEYFKSTSIDANKISEAKQELEQKRIQENAKIDEDLKKLDEILQQQVSKSQMEIEREKHKEQIEFEKRINIRKILSEELNRDITEDEIDECIFQMNNKKVNNIWEFADLLKADVK